MFSVEYKLGVSQGGSVICILSWMFLCLSVLEKLPIAGGLV